MRVADIFSLHYDLTVGGYQQRRGGLSSGKSKRRLKTAPVFRLMSQTRHNSPRARPRSARMEAAIHGNRDIANSHLLLGGCYVVLVDRILERINNS